MSLAYLRMLQRLKRASVTHLAGRLYRKCNHPFWVVFFFFQVQMVVTVQAVEVKYRTRFKLQSSRTPGTTIAFSKFLFVLFLTRGLRVNLSFEHAHICHSQTDK